MRGFINGYKRPGYVHNFYNPSVLRKQWENAFEEPESFYVSTAKKCLHWRKTKIKF